ncbi:MAG: type VI secretion system tube protein TssD [Nannocystales bacterium]
MSLSLILSANGTVLEGESTVSSFDRGPTIECQSFCDSVRTAREGGTGQATGRHSFDPIKFTKKMDKSSPLLAKALCNNEVIEASWTFYRPNPDGDGTVQQFFRIEVKEARIASIVRTSSDAIDPASANLAPIEEISIVFHTISWEDLVNNTIHEDNWREQA